MTSAQTITASLPTKPSTSQTAKSTEQAAPPSSQGDYLLNFEQFKRSEKGQQLVRWIMSCYDRCKSDRLVPQRQWDINMEMFKGRQWLALVGQGAEQRLATPAAPRHRVRATVNLTRPLIRTEISRMTSQQPTAFVIPASSNETAIFAAQGGETVWRSIVERKDFQNTIMNKAAFWTSITGNSFIKEVWDPRATDPGNVIKDPLTGESVPAVGDIAMGVVKPYNLFVPDLSLEDIEDQPYVFEAYLKPIEWVKKFFKGMITDAMIPNNGARETTEPRNMGGGQSSHSAQPASVLVIEAYFKPGGCEYFPEGGMVTLVGNELAQVAQTFPFTHGEYPYAHIRHIPTGEFYGDSVLVDTNPLQREYNGTRSHIIESKRRMAQPQLLVPKGAMQTHKYTSEPGALVEYLPGLGKPEPLVMQPLPSYVLQELPLIKSDMDDISGQHGPTRGANPGGGVIAATAIAFLQEKDDNIMSPTHDSVEAAIQKTARHTLNDVQDFWDIPRIVRTTGMDGAFDAVELKGSQISTDIKIEPGSSLPQSRPARQAFLMEMFQSGAISSSMLLDLLDMGGLQKLTEQIRIDMNQARRENLRMKQLTPDDINMYNQQKMMEANQGTQEQGPNGQPLWISNDPAGFPPMVDVHDYDNHEVHVTAHDNYRKSQEFETLDDTVKAEFQRHIRLHKAYLDQKAQQEMQQAMMGMPPESGAPGQDPAKAGETGPPQDPMAGQDSGGAPAEAAGMPQGGGM